MLIRFSVTVIAKGVFYGTLTTRAIGFNLGLELILVLVVATGSRAIGFNLSLKLISVLVAATGTRNSELR